MDKIIQKYKQVAYLSYQLIVHFKYSHLGNDDILFIMDVKHTQDAFYQPIVMHVPTNVDFESAFHYTFLHICENFHRYPEYATTSQTIKRLKNVTFNKNVHIRLIEEEEKYVEYYVDLI